MATRVDWDVVIVGAGPAGAAAALAARRAKAAARVLLVDRCDFPRDKPCGDGVAPHAFDLLEHLGVSGAAAGHDPVARLNVATTGGTAVERTMARPAHVIPRAVFDARLVDAAVAAGAKRRVQTVRGISRTADAVQVAGVGSARVVIGADGANGVVRRLLGLPGHRRMAVAIRGYAPGVGEGEPTQRIWLDVDGRPPGYAWSFPLADGSGRTNVGYGVVLAGSGAVRRDDLLGRMHALVPAAHKASALRAHHLPLVAGRSVLGRDRVLLAGDAAGLVNPLTGEGIWYALLSGMLAGRAAVADAHPLRRYRRDLRRALGGHHASVRVLAPLVTSPLVVAGGLRAAHRHQAVFDDLVELGLADGRLTPRLLAGTARYALAG